MLEFLFGSKSPDVVEVKSKFSEFVVFDKEDLVKEKKLKKVEDDKPRWSRDENGRLVRV